ncbi:MULTISPECIES: TIGR03759 family integrating conjugative element protein [unclassified Pseudomonas]|uniref:TIGR03759 family integrating conjugative element protein n=1 Tax=unclassified Pseudomonas TaxID=196821 RepID=UPI000C88DBFE|nr:MULTISPECIES: TIGR03759 family integrating conjugative element protein [unclassified Pseudomonas]PMX27605.1 TIGR03759 family integrating conjugative element protein [Pseudomonas sp. GW460-12]PMX35548.1 TIGR03759 family integrating conjugative element protein [Pseudomonas sp. MPR-R2A4]PMX42197.1 TIGR03759 family integrating conjugative element protein [Pseudomonas sp. MPR-R2A7]PMX53683.1 TIGR03759 family integrating conjugative element protein [Pseudomonas sp. MPR-R2A6]PMX90603.1 TIGR03759 f
MKQRHIVPALIVLLTSNLAQGAETRTADNTPSLERPMAIERTDEQHARDWGLSTEEWARYRALMQGPLGIYSPNLDPLTALGIEARSEQERQRYAELQVQAEAHRVEKLLAYQRAYDDAWQRLHANMPRVILPDAGPAFSPVTPAANGRIAVFVKDACAACDQTTLRLQAAGMEFDIYVVDSHADDARIRAWAQRIGIDPAKVRRGQVTLNHDSGRWLSLGLQGDLPAVVRQVGGQWQRQP